MTTLKLLSFCQEFAEAVAAYKSLYAHGDCLVTCLQLEFWC